ncbi:hypothetical protein HQ585_19130 [candidate division KSB1 bacterium]|nr:hypothetical protein [candidate division KSB1 bacterium]
MIKSKTTLIRIAKPENRIHLVKSSDLTISHLNVITKEMKILACVKMKRN